MTGSFTGKHRLHTFFMSQWWVLAWCLLVLWVGPARANAAQYPLRVLIEGPKASIMVAVSATAQLVQDDGTVVTLSPLQWFTVTPRTAGTLRLPEGGLVMVGDRWYPEAMQFARLKSGVAAINFVALETYLRGVVPREMPASWNQHALMAQAVAARTYALTSFQRRKWGPTYDLVDTVMDQVYGGFARYDARTGRSVTLTDSRTDQAIVQTRGIILNYAKVHGNYRADGIKGWVSYGQYQLPVRKGAMMSQKVSQQMAQAGWNYAQILTYWYQAELYRLS